MDDRWLIFEEGHNLFFYRSWTRKCVAILRYEVDRFVSVKIDPEFDSFTPGEMMKDIESVIKSIFGIAVELKFLKD